MPAAQRAGCQLPAAACRWPLLTCTCTLAVPRRSPLCLLRNVQMVVFRAHYQASVARACLLAPASLLTNGLFGVSSPCSALCVQLFVPHLRILPAVTWACVPARALRCSSIHANSSSPPAAAAVWRTRLHARLCELPGPFQTLPQQQLSHFAAAAVWRARLPARLCELPGGARPLEPRAANPQVPRSCLRCAVGQGWHLLGDLPVRNLAVAWPACMPPPVACTATSRHAARKRSSMGSSSLPTDLPAGRFLRINNNFFLPSPVCRRGAVLPAAGRPAGGALPAHQPARQAPAAAGGHAGGPWADDEFCSASLFTCSKHVSTVGWQATAPAGRHAECVLPAQARCLVAGVHGRLVSSSGRTCSCLTNCSVVYEGSCGILHYYPACT